MTAHTGTDRVTLIGAEMYGWSDETPARSAGGTAVYLPTEHIAAPGARVLVAGPHDAALIHRLVKLRANVTWLTRSHTDAQNAGVAFASAPDVRILGGCLSKLPTSDSYDVVIALDGLGRLSSAEGVTLSWSESLDILLEVLTPEGTLLLSLDNPIGIHRVVQPDAWYADRSDSAWLMADDVDPTKPGNLPDLLGRLADGGLHAAEVFAAFAEPTRPAALVSVGLLGSDTPPGQRAALADVISDVSRQGWREQPLLSEPQWLTSNTIRNGLGSGVAASWVTIARREVAGGPTADRVVIADQPGTDEWAVTYTLTPSPNGWHRTPMHQGPPQTQRTLGRDPSRLTGTVPPGEVLQSALIAMCLRHDHVGLRRILKAYAQWLRELVGNDDPTAPFATPANVSFAGDVFTHRDPSWEDRSGWPFELVATRGLRSFAVELLTGGYNHPWPSTMDANRLTIVLGAIAGLEIDTTTIDRAVARSVDIHTIVAALDEEGAREYGHRLAEAGATSGDVEVLSVQRLRQAHARQAEEIAGLEDKLKWLDHLLASHDRALLRARKQAKQLTGSISFRVGRAIISPAIATRNASRKTMKRLRTPSSMVEDGPTSTIGVPTIDMTRKEPKKKF